MSSNIIGNRSISKVKNQKLFGHTVNRSLILLLSGVAVVSSIATLLTCFALRVNNSYNLPIRVILETSAKLNSTSLQNLEKLSDLQLSAISQFCLISRSLHNIDPNPEELQRQIEYIELVLSDSKERAESLKIIENAKEGYMSNLNFVIKSPYSKLESIKDISTKRNDFMNAVKMLYSSKLMDMLSKVNTALDKSNK